MFTIDGIHQVDFEYTNRADVIFELVPSSFLHKVLFSIFSFQKHMNMVCHYNTQDKITLELVKRLLNLMAEIC
jgi:hypothetical protein